MIIQSDDGNYDHSNSGDADNDDGARDASNVIPCKCAAGIQEDSSDIQYVPMEIFVLS